MYYKRKIYINGRVCFPNESAENSVPRTDAIFKNNLYEDCQTGITLFNNIPNFGPVTNVPLDYSRLICLEVVKKLISFWLTGPFNVRISKNIVDNVSDRLLRCPETVKNDFVRKPRALSEFRQWKGVEFK